MAFRLSLDETAAQHDTRLDVDGVKFLADQRSAQYLDGLEIDVESAWGSQQLVAFNRAFGGGCG